MNSPLSSSSSSSSSSSPPLPSLSSFMSAVRSSFFDHNLSANNFLSELSNHREIFSFCLNILNSPIENIISSSPAPPCPLDDSLVEFLPWWCLKCLVSFVHSHYVTLSEGEKADIRQSLFHFMTTTYISSPTPRPYAVRCQFSLLLVGIVQVDFPQHWPSFFDDFLSILSSNPHIEIIYIFLTMLKFIDEDIVSYDENRPNEMNKVNSTIKDHMRSSSLPQICDCCYEIINTKHFITEYPKLITSCLETLKEYIEWIDIQLITSEKYLSCFYSLLGEEKFQCPAAGCLEEIVKKKMSADKKIELLQNIHLFDFLSKIDENFNQMNDNFGNEMSSLVDSLGTLLIEQCLLNKKNNSNSHSQSQSLTDSPTLSASPVVNSSDFQSYVSSLIHTTFRFSLKYFHHSNWEVSHEAVGFICQYLRLIVKPKFIFHDTLNPVVLKSQIEEVLDGLLSSIKHRETHDEDEEIALDSHRKDTISRVFIHSLVPVGPEDIAMAICGRLVDIMNNLGKKRVDESDPKCDPNIFYGLLKCFCEFPSAISGRNSNNSTKFFHSWELIPYREVIEGLLRVDLSHLENHDSYAGIQIWIMNVLSKFYKIYEVQNDTNNNNNNNNNNNSSSSSSPSSSLYPEAISVLLGTRGLRSKILTVRARACHAIKSIIYQVSDDTKRTLAPYVDQCLIDIRQFVDPILHASGTILSNSFAADQAMSDGMVPLDDAYFLMEAMGYITSSATVGPKCVQYTEMIIHWMREMVSDVLSSESTWRNSSESERMTLKLSSLIRASACYLNYLYKDAKIIFHLIWDLYSQEVSRCLFTCSHQKSIRLAFVFFTQKMTFAHKNASSESFSFWEKFILSIITVTEIFIKNGQQEDFVPFVELISHLISSYKQSEHIVEYLRECFAPICQKLFSLIQNIEESKASENVNGIIISTEAANSPLKLQKLGLEKKYYSLVHNVIDNKLLSIFISNANVNFLPIILQSLADGFVSDDTAVVQFVCKSMLGLLQFLFEANERNSPPLPFPFDSLHSFIFHNVSSKLYEGLFKPTNPSLSDVLGVIVSFISLQRFLLSVGRDNYHNELQSFLVNGIQMPRDACNQWMETLRWTAPSNVKQSPHQSSKYTEDPAVKFIVDMKKANKKANDEEKTQSPNGHSPSYSNDGNNNNSNGRSMFSNSNGNNNQNNNNSQFLSNGNGNGWGNGNSNRN